MKGIYWSWGKPAPIIMYCKMPLGGIESTVITIGRKIVYSSIKMDADETAYFFRYFEKGLLTLGGRT